MQDEWQTHASAMAKLAGGIQRVQILAGSGTDGKWVYHAEGQTAYHQLRAVMPTELVFDIGDHGDWSLCRDETHALWFALNRLGIPYAGALSGGVGTHTHVIGPKRLDFFGDWRDAASGLILDLASQILSHMRGGMQFVQADYRLLAPDEGSRVVREFGRAKGPLLPHKRVWTEGPGHFEPLPATREEAYARARPTYPNLRTCPALQSFDRSSLVEMGIPCPQGPQCIVEQCGDCPMRGLV